MKQMLYQGEIIAVFPRFQYVIIRTNDGTEFFGHFNKFVGLNRISEIKEGKSVTFTRSATATGKRPAAVDIEIEHPMTEKGAA